MRQANIQTTSTSTQSKTNKLTIQLILSILLGSITVLSANIWALENEIQNEPVESSSTNVQKPDTEKPACYSIDPRVSDSAAWAASAIEQFSDDLFEESVATVDACFSKWGPEAGHMQKALSETKKRCPTTGKVDRKTIKKIDNNYLINDVSMALWAKARSLDKLGQNEDAKQAYAQCMYMACGRVWDPKGWYWSPADDCLTQAKKLVKKEASRKK